MHISVSRFALTLALVLSSSLARSAEEPDAAEKKPKASSKDDKKPEAEATAPRRLDAIVHGLYVEAGIGGGYMAVNHKAEPDLVYPGISGSEGYAAGAQVSFALGYDLTSSLALQFVGGSTLVSGTRTDRVRDLAMLYGGAMLRLAVEIDPRLNLVLGAGGALTKADTGVGCYTVKTGTGEDAELCEKPQTGPAGVGTVGLEYFVHVRHFSVGLDAQVLAPLSPMRVFVALGPKLKYTF